MEPDSELLIRIGKESGLKNKEHIEKSWMQDRLLYYLSKKQDDLVFKGGTALYKFYSMPRFSKDLDFSTKKKVNEALLKPFCESNKIRLSYKTIKGSHLYKLRFRGVLTQSNTIRVDINVTKSIYSVDQKTFISHYPDVPPFVVNVLSLDEILAEKIHAIFNRTKARDLYDLFFILRITTVTPKIKRFIVKKLSDRKIKVEEKKLVQDIVERIDKYSTLWTQELRHFVLQDLPNYRAVKEFVEKKLSGQ